jgi:hypothetical protein
MYYNKDKPAGTDYDRQLLLQELIKYYGTDNLDELAVKLKADLTSAQKIKALMDATQFSKEGLILHINTIFDGLFSNSLIRKLRNEMKKIP